MEAIDFIHSNTEVAKTQNQYHTLHALKIEGPNGDTVTCWKPSWKDRIRILFGRKLWLNTVTYNHDFQPVFMSTKRTDVYYFD